MSDRFMVIDQGRRVVDMETGELFVDVGPTMWVNVKREGLVALEQINAQYQLALAELGAAELSPGAEVPKPPKR